MKITRGDEPTFARVPTFVVMAGLSHSAMSLYVALASFADNTTRACNPSRKSLMERAGIASMSTWQKAITELQDTGAVIVKHRHRQTSEYVLPVTSVTESSTLDSNVTDSRPLDSDVSVTDSVTPSVTETGTPTRLLELDSLELDSPSHSDGSSESPSTALAARDAEDLAFDTFWQLTVKKASKGQARRAFRAALKKVGTASLLTAWRSHNEIWARWSKDDRQYIPHPSTWLNGERWEDEPPQSREAMSDFAERVDAATSHLTEDEERRVLADAWGFGPPTESASLRAITGAREGEVR